MLTSSSQEQDIIDAYGSGANGYIRKLVDYGEFCDAIRETIAYWLNLNQVPAD
jgi:two-component system response regulator